MKAKKVWVELTLDCFHVTPDGFIKDRPLLGSDSYAIEEALGKLDLAEDGMRVLGARFLNNVTTEFDIFTSDTCVKKGGSL